MRLLAAYFGLSVMSLEMRHDRRGIATTPMATSWPRRRRGKRARRRWARPRVTPINDHADDERRRASGLPCWTAALTRSTHHEAH